MLASMSQMAPLCVGVLLKLLITIAQKLSKFPSDLAKASAADGRSAPGQLSVFGVVASILMVVTSIGGIDGVVTGCCVFWHLQLCCADLTLVVLPIG